MTASKNPGGIMYQIPPHTPLGEGQAKVQKTPSPGEFWQHFKGGIYRVVTLATVEVTKDRVVVYTGDSGTWTRPLSEFLGNVSRDDYEGPRFFPVEVSNQRELEALRRVVRAFASGSIGRAVDPETGTLKHWWGACGFIHGTSLQEVLKALADGSEDHTEHLEELVAVEVALKTP